MHTILMAVLLFCPSAGAQLNPADSELRRKVSEKNSNIEHLLASFAESGITDDAAALRKKLDTLKAVRRNMDEVTALRLELMEEIVRLQIGMQFVRHSARPDSEDLSARLATLEKVESALTGLVDKEGLARLKVRAESGRIKGALSSIRSAIQVYYGDTEGTFPDDLAVLTKNGKYLTEIPSVLLPGHKKASNAVRLVSGVRNMDELAEKVDDAGGWLYVNDKTTPMWGTIVFNCRHHDINDKSKPLMYTY